MLLPFIPSHLKLFGRLDNSLLGKIIFFFLVHGFLFLVRCYFCPGGTLVTLLLGLTGLDLLKSFSHFAIGVILSH